MIFLLRIDIAGRTWYLSSVPCEPERAGVEIAHHGALSVSGFAEALDVSGGSYTGVCTLSATLHLGDVEGWTLARDGHRLDGARAEVSLWEPGTSYGARHVLVTGTVQTGSSVPQDRADIEIEVTSPVIESAESWPLPGDVATVAAWPSLPADEDDWDLRGTPYPMPIGKLGDYADEDGAAQKTSTTEILIVDTTSGAEVGVVAGAPVAATTVRVWNDTDKDAADFAVSTTLDGDGNPRSTVSFAAAPAGWLFDGSERYYVTSWGEGGIVGDRDTGTPVGLGGAALYLLSRRYGVLGPDVLDVGAWCALLGVLAGWEVGLQPEAADPLELIQDALMPLCPGLWIVPGPLGIRPVYLGEGDGRPLIVGRDIYATEEDPAYAQTDPINSVAVSYAPSSARGDQRGLVTIDGSTDARAGASLARYGLREGEIEGAGTFDRGTAALAAQETIRLLGSPALILLYDAPPDTAIGLSLGARVRLTDADRDLSERAGWVVGRETDDGGMWTITIRLA